MYLNIVSNNQNFTMYYTFISHSQIFNSKGPQLDPFGIPYRKYTIKKCKNQNREYMMIGPFIFDRILNQQKNCFNFLLNEYIKKHYLRKKSCICILQDGTLIYFNSAIRKYPNKLFTSRLIQQSQSIFWTPRPPDCISIDF